MNKVLITSSLKLSKIKNIDVALSSYFGCDITILWRPFDFLIPHNHNKNYVFIGWGNRKSGINAQNRAKKYNQKFLLLEDGFLRSLNLADSDNSQPLSVICDDMGIYYDAHKPSRLEHILLYL